MKNILLLTSVILLVFSEQKLNAQCPTSSTPTNNCSWGDMINSYTLNSIASTGSGSACPTTISGYNSFSSPVWNLSIGQSYSFSSTVGSNSYPQGFAIWIDLNNNSQYDNNEMLFTSTTWAMTHSGTISIPSTATAGTNIRMRIRCAYYATITAGQACTNSIGSFGETEDYFVNLAAACPNPTISAHPQPRTTCEAGAAQFNVTASNASTYQWQVNNGSSWANVSGTYYSGATTSALTVSGMPISYNGYQYRCIVTGSCNNPVTSNAATLTVNAGATLVSQTMSDTICRGANTMLDVNAVGTIASYKWQMAIATVGVYKDIPANHPPFSGQNTNTLYIGQVPDSLNGYLFRAVVVGGLCPDINSQPIPLTVLQSPEVIENPVNDTVQANADAYFAASATPGSPVQFYWQASADGSNFYNINNNSIYKNVLTPALTIVQTPPALANWWFRAIIKSTDPQCGVFHDTSDAAQLRVLWGTTSVADVNTSSIDVTVYPNPVTGGELFINAPNAKGIYRANVIDKLGRVLVSREIELAGKPVAVPVSQLAPGIYNLHLLDSDGKLSETKTFTKQ